MILYPAIDLRHGKCVRLQQGRFDRETVYADDPIVVAGNFAGAGATWLHIVDLDGTKDGTAAQSDLVRRIAAAAPLKVQTGGGIRSEALIQGHLDAGIARIVIGSLALTNPGLATGWLSRFGADRIVLALDVKAGDDGDWHVATHGWQTDSRQTLFAVLDGYAGVGLQHLLCTDIGRDGTLKGPSLALYQEIRSRYPNIQLQASGGVASLEDLRALRQTGVAGAVVGRALYEGKFTLDAALAL